MPIVIGMFFLVPLLLGCWLGWRLWRRIWQPRVLDGP